jgi:hypothetical protein
MNLVAEAVPNTLSEKESFEFYSLLADYNI